MARSRQLISLYIALLLLLLAGRPVLASNPVPAATLKVNAALLAGAKSKPSAQKRFLVKLGAKADLSARTAGISQQSVGGGPGERAMTVRRVVAASLQSTARQSQAELMKVIGSLRREGHVTAVEPYWVVNAVAVTGDEAAMEAIAARSEVERLEPDRQIRMVQPDVQEAAQAAGTGPLWNLEMVGAPAAWAGGFNGSGAVVASLDTGVEGTHPALRTQFRGYNPAAPNAPSMEGNWLDVVNGRALPYDDAGHGTHTTGTVVGYDPETGFAVGVAPGARWIAVKAFDQYGSAYDSWLLQAGQWLLAPTDAAGVPHPEWAPDVINSSWGSDDNHDVFYREMVQSWRAAGIFPVFAAGNAGPAGGVGVPGNYPESFAVAAVDRQRGLASFSSRGPGPYSGVLKPNISAPGVQVTSSLPGGGYGALSGTSMATPHVTGAAALLRSVKPDLTVAEIDELLSSTAQPLTDSAYPQSPNAGYGAGLLDTAAAVANVGRLGRVAGSVRDAETGDPVPATLTLSPGARSAASSSDGVYLLIAPAGAYTITVSAFGYQTFSQSITVEAGAELNLSVSLAPLPKGTAQGTVTDAETGEPLAGAAVFLAGESRYAPVLTDSAGHFALTALSGTYTLQIQATGYESAAQSVTVIGGSSVTQNVQLVPARFRADDWTQFRGGPTRTAYNDGLVRPPLTRAWTIWSGGAYPLSYNTQPPIAVAGRIYAPAWDGFSAYDAGTGQRIWVQKSLGSSGGAYQDGKVLLWSGSSLVALDAQTGNTVWYKTFPFNNNGRTQPAPAVADGRTYASWDSGLAALDGTGKVLWQNTFGGGTPTVAGGRVYSEKICGLNGKGMVKAFDAAGGSTLWQWEWASSSCSGWEFSPIYADGMLLIYDGSTLFALDAEHGGLLWQMANVTGYPAVWAGLAFVPGQNGQISAVRARDGTVAGAYNFGAMPGAPTPVVANGILYAGGIRAFDLQTGAFLQLPDTGDIIATPMISHNLVMIYAWDSIIAYTPVTPPQEAVLTGQVTDAATGVAVKGAAVSLEGTTRLTASGESGSFGLTAPPGTYAAVVTAVGYQPDRATVTLTAVSTTVRQFSLASIPRGAIAGTVTDQESGSPVPAAKVELVGDATVQKSTADPAGQYSLEAFAGSYTLQVSAPGYATSTFEVMVPAGTTEEVAPTLKPLYPWPDDWTSEFGGSGHGGENASLLAPPLQLAWQAGTFQARPYSRVAVGHGRLFALNTGGSLRAFDLLTGATLWQQAGGAADTSPAYDRNRVYVSQEGDVSAFVADTGKPLWVRHLGSFGVTSPTAAEGRVYAMVYSTLFALNGETGEILWTQQLMGGSSNPAVADGVVYVSGGGPWRYALDAATGEILWTHDGCGCSSGGGQPAVVSGGLFLEIAWPDLTASDARTGRVLWKKSGFEGVPVALGGLIYANLAGGASTAVLNPADGTTLATLPVTGRLAGANGYLYGDGATVINLANRSTVGTYSPGGKNVTVAEDRVITVDESGILTVLKPASPAPPAAYIHGRVTGRGVPEMPLRATLTIDGTAFASHSPDGSFDLRVPAGAYTLTASAPHWETKELSVTATAGSEAQISVVLEPQAKGTVFGGLIDAFNRRPLASAWITVAEDLTIPPTVTDGEGSYQLELFPGTYTLRAEAPGHDIGYYPVTVQAAGAVNQEMTLIPGVASDCPQDRCGAARQGGGRAAPPYAFAWATDVVPSSQGWSGSSPVIAGGVVFSGSADRYLVATNLFSGEERWRSTKTGTPVYGDGRVYVTDTGGNVAALEAATGRQLWLNGYASGWPGWPVPPLYENGRVFVSGRTTGGDLLRALDAASGRTLWERIQTVLALTAGEGRLFTVGAQVTSSDPGTGAVLWSIPAPPEAMYGLTAYADGVILAGPAYGTGYIAAYDPADGRQLWHAAGTMPVASGGKVFTWFGGKLLAVDLHTGAKLSEVEMALAQEPHLPPTLVGGLLMLGQAEAYDPVTGQRVWQYAGGPEIPLAGGEGYLLVTDPEGHLTALRGGAGQVRVTAAPELRANAAGTQVELAGNGIQLSTVVGEDGTAVFSQVPPGSYTLTVARPLYVQSVVTISTNGQGLAAGPYGLSFGDLDQNGSVGTEDLAAVLAGWRSLPVPAYDVNDDGQIDLVDLSVLARNHGRQGPQPR